MIERAMYKVVNQSIEHFPAVLLIGPRQVGKNTLLYNQFKDRFFYVSFEDRFELSSAKKDPRTFLALHPYPLILDEAQRVPELFPELARTIDESRRKRGNKASNGMYILSCSVKTSKLDKALESLAGRVAILDMSNLSNSEILNRENLPFSVDPTLAANRATAEENEEKIFERIVRGFFPALYDDPGIDTRIYYSSYLSTYMEKDIREEIQLENEGLFLDFLKLLASNTGQEFIYDSYSKQVGVATNTIKKWVEVLRRTGILYFVESYHEDSIVKRVVKRPKMYFFDTGLAAYLCGIDSAVSLERSFLKGRFFETFVFNEIRKSYLNEGRNLPLYYYRDTNQNEIDLVLVNNGEMSLIEIKSGQEFRPDAVKAFRNLDKTKLIHKNNAIICNCPKVSLLSDGTYLIPVSSL